MTHTMTILQEAEKTATARSNLKREQDLLRRAEAARRMYYTSTHHPYAQTKWSMMDRLQNMWRVKNI